MIKLTRGDLFASGAQALVNTVNTVGIMGGGIALEFKKRFPENFRIYFEACRKGHFSTGEMFITRENIESPFIINFPTKQHWRDPSKMEWIEEGLVELKRAIIDNEIKSIAIPALGCGLGGLDWDEVKPKIIAALDDLENVEVLVYEPLE